LSDFTKAENSSDFTRAKGVSDFKVWDIGQITVSNFDWLPFTPSDRFLRSFRWRGARKEKKRRNRVVDSWRKGKVGFSFLF
jgi:hypothetical protein